MWGAICDKTSFKVSASKFESETPYGVIEDAIFIHPRKSGRTPVNVKCTEVAFLKVQLTVQSAALR